MKTSNRSGPVSLLFCLILLSPTACAQEKGPDPVVSGHLQSVVDAFHAGGDFPGVSASVSLSDGSVVAVVAGEADTVKHLPMRPDHRLLQHAQK